MQTYSCHIDEINKSHLNVRVSVMKKNQVKESASPKNDPVESADPLRREFLKKYGKLAAITPLAMTVTLHSNQALASGLGNGNGQGGGWGPGGQGNGWGPGGNPNL